MNRINTKCIFKQQIWMETLSTVINMAFNNATNCYWIDEIASYVNILNDFVWRNHGCILYWNNQSNNVIQDDIVEMNEYVILHLFRYKSKNWLKCLAMTCQIAFHKIYIYRKATHTHTSVGNLNMSMHQLWNCCRYFSILIYGRGKWNFFFFPSVSKQSGAAAVVWVEFAWFLDFPHLHSAYSTCNSICDVRERFCVFVCG